MRILLLIFGIYCIAAGVQDFNTFPDRVFGFVWFMAGALLVTLWAKEDGREG